MVTIEFYTTFEKKTNSTKQPSSTAALTISGNLIKPCSILHPVIQIKRLAADASPEAYVYADIPAFNRYYFVRDWIWMDGIWEVHMDCDVLASWKTDIGELSEYILRTNSTSTDHNPMITDTIYPATNDFVVDEDDIPSAFADTISTGCYIVGIISGGSSDAVGAISYYAMNSSQFGYMKSKLFSDDNLDIMGIIDTSTTPPTQIVQDLSQEVLKTLYNPYQYIASCMWFPFAASSIPNKQGVNSIKIGWWDYPLAGFLLYAQRLVFTETESGTVPSHPQATARGYYLNFAPYTTRTLIGRFGTVALDPSYYNVMSSVSVVYKVDLITGQCKAEICINTYDIPSQQIVVAQRDFLLGVPIQIAQVGTDYLGAAATAVSATANTVGKALSFDVAGAISSAATGIYNTLQSAMPQVETGGTNGSFLAPIITTKLLSTFYKIVDENIDHKGRPLCESRTIKNLTGFILCAEGDHDIACMLEEKEIISRFLTGGFYWE